MSEAISPFFFLNRRKRKATHLEHALVLRVTGGLQRNVGHGSSLAHDKHLHPLGHLTTRQHRGVHHLPVLRGKTNSIKFLCPHPPSSPVPSTLLVSSRTLLKRSPTPFGESRPSPSADLGKGPISPVPSRSSSSSLPVGSFCLLPSEERSRLSEKFSRMVARSRVRGKGF